MEIVSFPFVGALGRLDRDQKPHLVPPDFQLDIRRNIEKFKKQGMNVDPARYAFFSEVSSVSHDSAIPYEALYYDARYNFLLMVRAPLYYRIFEYAPEFIPIATIGFFADFFDRVIIIRQIQGVFGRGKYLKPLRWERMLVAVVVDFAKRNGASRVEIIAAKKSEWYCATNAERMYMRYDVTARRLGFSFFPETGNYARVF